MPIISPAPLEKMTSELADVVNYQLPIGDQHIAMNPLIGSKIKLTFNGVITCCHCGRKTKKSYSQGFCFPCMQKLAQCDMCIMKPETCHFEQGTCREPQWAESHCMTTHYVYLANSSGLKVGITRSTQLPTRWIDQGATQALPIVKVQTRLQSGLVEVAFGQFIADKTNWREMLKGDATPLNLPEIAADLLPKIKQQLADIQLRYGENAIEVLNEIPTNINYPVTQYLKKIASFNLDKIPEIESTLIGIKGQYLIFEDGVINMRKYSSYHIGLSF